MKRLAILLVLVSMSPLRAEPASGGADHAAYLSATIAEGDQVTVDCSATPSGVEANFYGLTITNGPNSPKPGRINSLVVGSYSKNGDAFVYARAGDTSTGATVPIGLQRPSEAFSITVGAASESILRIGAASWGDSAPCIFLLNDEVLTLEPLASAAAQALRSTDFRGTLGIDASIGDVSVEQSIERVVNGYILGFMTCLNGRARATGPEGQSYEVDNVFGGGAAIVLTTTTSGTWTFDRMVCADAIGPVLWYMSLPA